MNRITMVNACVTINALQGPNASHCTSSRTIGVMNTTCQITLPKTRGARKIVVRSAIPGSWTGPSFTQQSLLHGAVMRRAKSSPQRLHPPRSPSGLSLLLTIKAGMERAEDLEGQDRKTGLGRQPRLSSGLLALACPRVLAAVDWVFYVGGREASTATFQDVP